MATYTQKMASHGEMGEGWVGRACMEDPGSHALGDGAGDVEERERRACTADSIEGDTADGGDRPGTSDGNDALDDRSPKKASVTGA